MQFPDELIIRVVEQGTKKPQPGIALLLTLRARFKNDYNYPVLTGPDGRAIVSKRRVLESIDLDRRLFLMDYSSSLEECGSSLRIQVCSQEEVERMVEAMRTWQKASGILDEEIESFRRSLNRRFSPVDQEVVLDTPSMEAHVEIEVRRSTGVLA
jgi:hypothetical protein